VELYTLILVHRDQIKFFAGAARLKEPNPNPTHGIQGKKVVAVGENETWQAL
jgi:hypothetical protein